MVSAPASSVPNRSGPAYAIRPMAVDDVEQLVQLHRACYPQALLTALGPRLLRVVYASYATSPACVSLVAVSEGRIVAAVNGAIGDGFVRGLLRRHPFLVARLVCRLLWQRPGSWMPLFRRAVALAITRRHSAEAKVRRRFVWRSQAVAPAWRGAGLIFPLIREMITELRARGVEEIYSTPEADNLASVWIHRVLRFQRMGERVAEDGRQYTVFILPLGLSKERDSVPS